MAHHRLQKILAKVPDATTEIRTIAPKHFTAILADLRIRSGMRREDLADKAGIHYRSIENWENETYQPRLLDMEAWANALGMDIYLVLVPRTIPKD